MRIGYDAKRVFSNFTGLGNYARTLLRDLIAYYPEHQYYLFTPQTTDHSETTQFLLPPFQPVTPGHPFGNLWRTMGITGELRTYGIDLYHGLSHELPVGIARSSAKSIVTIHDLIFKHFPSHYPRIDRFIYDRKFRYSCEQADHIIAISEATRRDILRFYTIDPAKITVIYQDCDPAFGQPIVPGLWETLQRTYSLPDAYLLYVGAITPRKDLMSLLKALTLLPASLDIPLVVIGQGKDYKQKALNFIHDHQLQGRVIMLDRIPLAHLPAIYHHARVFVYPSHYEGFGIPVIEALNAGVPVITTDVAALPEAGGPESLYVRPGNSEEIAAGIGRILTDASLATRMRQEGYQHVRQFDREKITRSVMGLYQELIAAH